MMMVMMKTFFLLSLLIPAVTSEDDFTAAPTPLFINVATESPVAAPIDEVVDTESPTRFPTAAPIPLPTVAPVSPPTRAPIPAPVPVPVAAPTLPPIAPVPLATNAPTLAPSPALVVVVPDTANPTGAPVVVSTPATIAPTLSPTISPTAGNAVITSRPTSTIDSGNLDLPPTLSPDDELLSLPVWIGIGVAGLLVLGAVVYIALRAGSDRSPSPRAPSQNRLKKQDPHLSSQHQPEVEIQITNDDDISTIGYPTVATRSYRGDQQSLPTVDYDYTRSYGAGQDGSVVSSAAGTFGDTIGMSDTIAPSVTTEVINRMSEPRVSSQQRSRSSRVVEIVAPPGKLGVVLDASDDHDDPISCPVVHTVKENSPLIHQLQVGDKLIALDDEDVRGMTAMQVSKLISMKSANPRRKFTILRSS